jgi:hypothetical protein
MEQPEEKVPLGTASASENYSPPPLTSAARPVANSLTSQACPSCRAAPTVNGGLPPRYVYAIGRIEARFPRPSVEKEFAQVTGRAETAGLTDRQVVQKVLAQRQNRYLARQLCWAMTIAGESPASDARPHGPRLRYRSSRTHCRT